jgi:hypothetical protein
MANEMANAAATTDTKTEIVSIYPQMIVTGTAEKPYFQIVYLDLKDGDIHVGFGSYDLAYVFQWLKEFFGVTHASAVNPESLRPKGRWVQCFEDWRQQIEGDKCSACGFEHYGCGIKHYHYCPNCGAKMEG